VTTKLPATGATSLGLAALRVGVVAALAVSGYLHVRVSSLYAANKTSVVSERELFLAQAVVAGVVALAVLLRGRRPEAALALIVTLGSLAAVLVYRYLDVGTLGPLPNMYDPGWFTDKTISAYAEAIGAVLSLGLVLWPRRRPAL